MTCSVSVEILFPECFSSWQPYGLWPVSRQDRQVLGHWGPEPDNHRGSTRPLSQPIKDERHQGKHTQRNDQPQESAEEEKSHAKHTERHEIPQNS